MIMEASPFKFTVVTIVVALLLLVWLYLAARLSGAAVARSWFEFKNKIKKEKKSDKEKTNS